MTRLSVLRLDDPAALAALAPEWEELRSASPASTPFQSAAFALAYWKLFHPGRLASVALHEGRDLVALAALYVEESERGSRLVPLGLGPADHLDLLVRRERRIPALDTLSAVLAERHPRWEFDDLLPGAELLALPAPAGRFERVSPWKICPELDLSGNDPETLSAVPPGQRRKWRMARRRAARRTDIRIEDVPPADLPRAAAEVAALVDARRRAIGDRSSYSDPRMVALLADAAAGLAASGGTVALRCRAGSETAGLFIGFADARAVHGYACGFDPRFAHWSPGTLLVGHAIAEATRAGRRSFRFLRGDEAYKRAWGAREVRTLRRVVRMEGDEG